MLNHCGIFIFGTLIWLFVISSLVDHLVKYLPTQTSNWQLPKIHAMTHYYEDIKRGGVTSEYSAEMWENLHKTLMKGPYVGSNHKNVEGQLMKHHEVGWSLTILNNKLQEELEEQPEEKNESQVLIFDMPIFIMFPNSCFIYK